MGSAASHQTVRDLNTTIERAKTFNHDQNQHGWPLHQPTVEQVASSGFRYAPKRKRADRTKCVYCGIVMHNWSAQHDPSQQHRNGCKYLSSNPRNDPVVPKVEGFEAQSQQALDRFVEAPPPPRNGDQSPRTNWDAMYSHRLVSTLSSEELQKLMEELGFHAFRDAFERSQISGPQLHKLVNTLLQFSVSNPWGSVCSPPSSHHPHRQVASASFSNYGKASQKNISMNAGASSAPVPSRGSTQQDIPESPLPVFVAPPRRISMQNRSIQEQSKQQQQQEASQMPHSSRNYRSGMSGQLNGSNASSQIISADVDPLSPLSGLSTVNHSGSGHSSPWLDSEEASTARSSNSTGNNSSSTAVVPGNGRRNAPLMNRRSSANSSPISAPVAMYSGSATFVAKDMSSRNTTTNRSANTNILTRIHSRSRSPESRDAATAGINAHQASIVLQKSPQSDSRSDFSSPRLDSPRGLLTPTTSAALVGSSTVTGAAVSIGVRDPNESGNSSSVGTDDLSGRSTPQHTVLPASPSMNTIGAGGFSAISFQQDRSTFVSRHQSVLKGGAGNSSISYNHNSSNVQNQSLGSGSVEDQTYQSFGKIGEKNDTLIRSNCPVNVSFKSGNNFSHSSGSNSATPPVSALVDLSATTATTMDIGKTMVTSLRSAQNAASKIEDPRERELDEHIRSMFCKLTAVEKSRPPTVLLEGGSFVGEMKGPLRHGFGRTLYDNGNEFAGEWKDDIRHGYGMLITSTGTYMGLFKNGERDGYGRFTWSNCDTFVGDWVRDAREGEGRWVSHAGNVYHGGWSRDRRNGYGLFKWANGDVYEGNWVDDRMQGEGSLAYSSGNIYMGEFDCDVPHGHGRFTWIGGDVYEGPWCKGEMRGDGRIRYANGDIYVGSVSPAGRDGWGRLTCSNGGTYDGDWVADRREGNGQSSSLSGECYSGQWKSDLMHGRGVLTLANGHK